MMSSEAEKLFNRMVEAHLASKPEHRSWVGTLSSAGYLMLFSGDGPWTRQAVDRSALDDLVGWGMVRCRSSGKNLNYDIPSQGIQFHRILRQLCGRPIDTVGSAVRSLVDSDAFAATYPGAADHLSEAFSLLWSDRTDDQVVSELGAHLRSAVIDVVTAVAGPSDDPENVKVQLKGWLLAQHSVEARSAKALVELVNATQSVNQRITHVRDEAGKGRLPILWSELRRACFMTSTTCYELVPI